MWCERLGRKAITGSVDSDGGVLLAEEEDADNSMAHQEKVDLM
jgi:hypothetical protein